MGEMINVEADQSISSYLVKPQGKAKGAIIVIHEVWGLVDHIKSVADRFADEGYIALAPNLLFEIDFSEVNIPELQNQLFDPKTRSEAQPKLRQLMTPMQDPSFGSKTIQRLQSCFDYLYNLPGSNQKVAVIGFCFGGTYSFSLAVNEPRLKIAFPFYGHADQTASELSQIKCPVRAFYGENDENLISSLNDLKKRMAVAKVDFEAKVYPDAGHAFFNDTNVITYKKDIATDAWNIVQEELDNILS
ncbi:MAG: dienelactone hydrolase family protein [Candidatus Saccharimonadales bacterium]